MKKVGACFYPQNIRRTARKFLSAQGASPEQWVNTSVRVLCLKSIWRFDRQWERLQRVFTLRISGAPPESSFPLKAHRPSSGWTLLYAFYAWNLSDASIGNEKGYSVFLPSEYQARRPKVPFRSRRVAPTLGEHFCPRFMLEIYLTFRSAMRKVTACFYPQNIRRAARKFLSAQGASPEQWVNTSVRCILEIYLTVRSAMRKVTACFYPQNIRRAARKFLSAQGASPEQWVNTSVRCILEIYLTVRSAMRKVTACFYPQNIRRAARKFLSAQGASPEQWVNTSVRCILEIYLTVRSAIRKVTACFYPQKIRRAARKFLSVQGASPEQWANTSVRFILGNLSDAQ